MESPAADPVDDDEASLLEGPANEDPEIVVALVAALGTEVDQVLHEFDQAFALVDYSVDVVRVSDLIHGLYEDVFGPSSVGEHSRAALLMDEGDALRRAVGHGGAAIALAINEIRARRQEATSSSDTERRRVASIIRTVKHPDEVELLRQVYGPRVIVVGIWSQASERAAGLRRRLEMEHPDRRSVPGWYASETEILLRRDEKDQVLKLGQRVRDAFGLADAYVALRPGGGVHDEIERLVQLLFGSPFITPRRDEQAMFLAFASMLRSSAAGRQVGAAVVNGEGEVIVTGTNEVPRAGGGQYWDSESPDHRDFTYGFDANDRLKLEVIQDLLYYLREANWLDSSKKSVGLEQLAAESMRSGGPLAQSRVNDLIEFGRIAHAEMAAICTAARRGSPLLGSDLYTTTFPCHECARLILAAGVNRVLYIDPYPKSQVPAMYPHQIDVTGAQTERQGSGPIPFIPFGGIAPRLFPEVFVMAGRDRDRVTGTYSAWNPQSSVPRRVVATGANAALTLEQSIVAGLLARLKSAGWTPGQVSKAGESPDDS